MARIEEADHRGASGEVVLGSHRRVLAKLAQQLAQTQRRDERRLARVPSADQAGGRRRTVQGRQIKVCRQVGLPHAGKDVLHRTVIAVSHQRARHAARSVQLLCVVAVVDDLDVATLELGSRTPQPLGRREPDLRVLAVGERDPVSRQMARQLGRRRLSLRLHEAAVRARHEHLAQPAVAPHHSMHRQRVQELVGQDAPDDRSGGRLAREVDGLMLQRVRETRPVRHQPCPDGGRQGASTGPVLPDHEFRRPIQALPHLIQLAPHHAPEEGVQLGSGQEIALPGGAHLARRVVAQPGLGQGALHEASERDAACRRAPDLLAEALDQLPDPDILPDSCAPFAHGRTIAAPPAGVGS